MPLRKWMTLHGHPGWYSWLVVIGGCIVSMVVSVTISNRASQAALERDRQQRIEQQQRDAQQREAGRQASCMLIETMSRAYSGRGDELSPVGKEVAQAWADLAKLC